MRRPSTEGREVSCTTATDGETRPDAAQTSAPPSAPDAPPAKSRRGFAAMDPERQREIARLGGRAAQERGSAHLFTSKEAREAGRKGGASVSQDREHMSAIGRKGGKRRHQKRSQSGAEARE